MAYGLVGDKVDTYGPTIQGMGVLRDSVITQIGKYPVLHSFVETGATDNPQGLAEDCKEFVKTIEDENLVHTLEHLAKVASKCQEKLELC